jgi:hypothetical protein
LSDVIVWIIVIVVVAVLVGLLIKFILTIVSGAADVSLLVKLGRDLKSPTTSPERLHASTKTVAAALHSGTTTEQDTRRLLLAIVNHPNAYLGLHEWIGDFARALTAKDAGLVTSLIYSGPPLPDAPSEPGAAR